MTSTRHAVRPLPRGKCCPPDWQVAIFGLRQNVHRDLNHLMAIGCQGYPRALLEIALFRDEGATDRTRSVDKDGLRTVGKR